MVKSFIHMKLCLGVLAEPAEYLISPEVINGSKLKQIKNYKNKKL